MGRTQRHPGYAAQQPAEAALGDGARAGEELHENASGKRLPNLLGLGSERLPRRTTY